MLSRNSGVLSASALFLPLPPPPPCSLEEFVLSLVVAVVVRWSIFAVVMLLADVSVPCMLLPIVALLMDVVVVDVDNNIVADGKAKVGEAGTGDDAPPPPLVIKRPASI